MLPQDISGASVPRPTDAFVFRRIDEECLLVPVRASAGSIDSMYVLSGAGVLIWESLGSATVEEIVRRVAEVYDVADDEAAADMREFLCGLHGIGAIVLARP